jgi:hypothetical protein
MTQNTHDFVEWANPLNTHQSGHAMGYSGDLQISRLPEG